MTERITKNIIRVIPRRTKATTSKTEWMLLLDPPI